MREPIQKAEVLIEALPYIQAFRGRIVVVKYGGSTMESGEPAGILRDVVFMECVGMRPVLVHGGGGRITRRLAERGIAPRFVGGLRVTDADTMATAAAVLAEVNREIVETIGALGGQAKGFTGAEGLLGARRHLARVERNGRAEEADIGFVGDVERVETGPIRAACRKGLIPVIAPIGTDAPGQLYNINADTAAAEIAAALRASKLVLLTDVRGIMRHEEDPDSLIGALRTSDVETLIQSGVIRGGMLPKVRAAARSVAAGVGKTHIIDGRLPHSLLLEIFTDEGIGTEITGD
ncbi:MAG: acetylglutamate kinase [bacterium]|nr:acetylglutamate kinase [bacterium]